MAQLGTFTNPIQVSAEFSTSYKASVKGAASGNVAGGNPPWTLRISKIYWENPTTVGDLCRIVNPDNNLLLLELRCEVANQSQLVDWSAYPQIWQDFAVNDLDSGTLYLYLG